MSNESNILPTSNVYQVTRRHVRERRYDERRQRWLPAQGAFDDARFAREIRGQGALVQLVGPQVHWQDAVTRLEELVSREQIEVYFGAVGSGRCGCAGVGKTIGTVRRGDRLEVHCRCPNGNECQVQPQNTHLLNPHG